MNMNDQNELTRFPLRSFVLGVVLATATALVLSAQSPETGKRSESAASVAETKEADYTSVSRVLGANVFLEADRRAAEQAALEGVDAKRPKATVDDLLIDVRSGQIASAVISLGGFLGIGDKAMLVPAGDLRWNSAASRYELAWTKEKLEARPAFDLSKACETGLDEAEAGARGATLRIPRAAERAAEVGSVSAADAANGQTKVAGTSFTVAKDRLCRASELAVMPVSAGSQAFGKVNDLIVDRQQDRVVLAVVDHGVGSDGGREYLVPYPFLTMVEKEGASRLLCVGDMTPAQLEMSVVYERTKNGVVDLAAAKLALSKVGPSKQAQGERPACSAGAGKQ